MAKINLYKIINELDNDDFKNRLRDSLQGFVPDLKLKKDAVFSAFLKKLEGLYANHSVEVPDACIMEWKGK